jgi:hypothetical protein
MHQYIKLLCRELQYTRNSQLHSVAWQAWVRMEHSRQNNFLKRSLSSKLHRVDVPTVKEKHELLSWRGHAMYEGRFPFLVSDWWRARIPITHASSEHRVIIHTTLREGEQNITKNRNELQQCSVLCGIWGGAVYSIALRNQPYTFCILLYADM